MLVCVKALCKLLALGKRTMSAIGLETLAVSISGKKSKLEGLESMLFQGKLGRIPSGGLMRGESPGSKEMNLLCLGLSQF